MYFTNVTKENLQVQFRDLVKAYHPDKHPGEFEKYNAIMRAIIEEYQRIEVSKLYNCVEKVHPLRPSDKSEYIDCKESAKLIRQQLKLHFPGVKFSVRMRDRSTIYIEWENGPAEKTVKTIVNGFVGSGFDAMTDLGYSVYSWLLPNGSAVFAGHYENGMDNEFWTPKPHNDAKLVHFGSNFISTIRNYTKDVLEKALAHFNFANEPVIEFWNGSYNFQWDYKLNSEIHFLRDWLYTYSDYVYPYSSDNTTAATGKEKEDVTATATATNNVTVVVRHNTDKNGIEIVFTAKPDAKTITLLKNSGFRWSHNNGLWYTKFNEYLFKRMSELLTA